MSCKTIDYNQDDLLQPDKLVRLSDYQWIKEKFIAVNDSTTLHLLYSSKKENKPAIFYLHGNSGNILSRNTFEKIKWFHQLGFQVITFDYRGYGKSSGTPKLKTIKQDASLIYDKILKQGLADNVIVYGFSLGTWPAIHLSKKPECPPLVLEGSLVSPQKVGEARLKNLGIPLRWFVSFSVDSSLNIIDTREIAKTVKCPTLIFHGKKDKAIPAKFSKELYELIPAEKKYLKIFPNGEHGLENSKLKSKFLKFIEDVNL